MLEILPCNKYTGSCRQLNQEIRHLDKVLRKFSMLACPNCLAKLQMPKPQDVELICWSCKITWAKIHGVWDFRLNETIKSLAIFQETEYLRWLDIFGKQEISSWKIYATKLNRFFSQAGHRILARKLNLDVDELQWVIEVGAGDGLFYQYTKKKVYWN